MRSLLVAASALASINPSDSTAYNFVSNTADAASKCATDIDNARTALTNAQSALTADDDSYDQLRNVIDLTKATYTAGNDNGVYSSDNWNAFKSAYEAAYTAIMAVGSGYQPNGTVTPLAVELQQAYDALLEEAQNSRVDTTALVEAITKANGLEAYETYFTPDTYANLTVLSPMRRRLFGALRRTTAFPLLHCRRRMRTPRSLRIRPLRYWLPFLPCGSIMICILPAEPTM